MIRWLRDLFKPEGVRLELRLVTWDEANKLLLSSPDNWQIAPEEDSNRRLGYVWLELRSHLQTNSPQEEK